MRALTFIAISAAFAAGCLDPQGAGNLLPPTADEDDALPQVRLTIAGAERALHLETFGDPTSPPLFVLPGGPGADFRMLLPLKALADRYFVVMWDQHGAGLSERVPASELTLDSYDEELAAVRDHLAPGRPVTLVGHSFGGAVIARYAALHPQQVAELVLLEPAIFQAAARANYRGGQGSNFLDPSLQDALWQNEYLSPQDHAAADYKVFVAIQESTRNFYCEGQDPDPYVMWRYGAVASEATLARIREAGAAFDWTTGIEAFTGRSTIIAGECGALGAPVQEEHNVNAIPGVGLTRIDGAGHITLFTSHAEQTLAALRATLEAYR